jgi:hypothetical protein
VAKSRVSPRFFPGKVYGVKEAKKRAKQETKKDDEIEARHYKATSGSHNMHGV